MVALDFIIIAIILIFAFWGYKKGFLEALGSLIGVVLASVVASNFYVWLGDLLGGSDLAYIVSFIVLFAVTIKLLGLLFWLMGKIFKIMTILPFLQQFEKIIGAVLGLAEGILLMAVLMYFLSKYPVHSWLTSQMSVSFINNVLLDISEVFLPLFPEAFKKLRD